MNRVLRCVFCVLMPLLAGVGAEAPNEPAAPPPPEIEITVYRRDTELQRGQTTDVVVELVNRSAKAVTVPDYIGLQRVVEKHPTLRRAPVFEQRMPPRGKGHAIGLRCHVPHDAGLKYIAPRWHRNIQVRQREVLPGDSLLLKVELPADAFEVGECKLQAYLMDGPTEVARCVPVAVRCTPADAGLKKKEKGT